MVILDATIVNVALPSIQADLDFSQGDLQWVVNAYTLVFGGFLLLGGRAGRPVRTQAPVPGRRGRLLRRLARSTAWRSPASCSIAARGLQGLGAALVSPAALSIVTTTFAEGEERTKALGVWSAIAAGGGAFGLLLGGILTEPAVVGVDLLRQRADRHRRVRAVAALRARVRRAGAARTRSTSRARSRSPPV